GFRLGDVAGAGVVLDDLRHAVDGHSGALRACILDRTYLDTFGKAADRASSRPRQPARPRQFAPRLRHAVGLPLVRATAHHLVRKLARRNSVVSQPPAPRLAVGGIRVVSVSILRAFCAAAFTLAEKKSAFAGASRAARAGDARYRYVLDHCSRVLSNRCEC